MAAAIAKGEAPVNGCPVGGAPVAEKVGAIMGTSAEAVERKVAFVRCKGTCEVTHNQGNYVGIKDCRSAALSGLNVTDCGYGCLGFGSCAAVCPQDAIRVVDGVAMVNRKKCVGCGLCVKACPKGLIELVPESKRVIVQCSNKDKGPMVKKVCTAGCIGCGICQKQCECDAIHVDRQSGQGGLRQLPAVRPVRREVPGKGHHRAGAATGRGHSRLKGRKSNMERRIWSDSSLLGGGRAGGGAPGRLRQRRKD